MDLWAAPVGFYAAHASECCPGQFNIGRAAKLLAPGVGLRRDSPYARAWHVESRLLPMKEGHEQWLAQLADKDFADDLLQCYKLLDPSAELRKQPGASKRQRLGSRPREIHQERNFAQTRNKQGRVSTSVPPVSINHCAQSTGTVFPSRVAALAPCKAGTTTCKPRNLSGSQHRSSVCVPSSCQAAAQKHFVLSGCLLRQYDALRPKVQAWPGLLLESGLMPQG